MISALLKVRARDGRLLPLRLNRAQKAFSSAPRSGRHIILKARQLGFTTYVAARFLIATITRPGTLSVLVAHDLDSAQAIFEIVRRFADNLPEHLREGCLRTSRANVRQLVFPELDSQFRVESAADENCGRGLTIQNLHCSEVSRWPGDAAATLASLRASFPQTMRGAFVLESTPNGAAGCFYGEWQRAGEKGVQKHFFPWWWEPSYRRDHPRVTKFTEEEAALRNLHELSPNQIAFRREMQANLQNLAPQEFAEDASSCFLASGDCVFDLEMIQRRLALVTDASTLRDNGRLQIWFPPQRGREYIIGCDPAGGGASGDYACAEVIDRKSGMQCAELRGHWPPREFAARIAELATEYNRALLGVERNNHGHAVLAYLTSTRKYENLYCGNDQPGWLTTNASRPRMLESFASALSEESSGIYSRALLDECKTFVRRENGTAGAAGGAHDDCIIAMAVALAVREEVATSRSRDGNLLLTSLPN
ncbi:MAG: terminase [Terriglobales bacterium]